MTELCAYCQQANAEYGKYCSDCAAEYLEGAIENIREQAASVRRAMAEYNESKPHPVDESRDFIDYLSGRLYDLVALYHDTMLELGSPQPDVGGELEYLAWLGQAVASGEVSIADAEAILQSRAHNTDRLN